MDLVPIPNLKMSIKSKVWVTMEIFHQGLRVTSIEALVTQVFWIAYPSERLLSPVYQSRFYDFWIEAGWIHLIS